MLLYTYTYMKSSLYIVAPHLVILFYTPIWLDSVSVLTAFLQKVKFNLKLNFDLIFKVEIWTWCYDLYNDYIRVLKCNHVT